LLRPPVGSPRSDVRSRILNFGGSDI